MRPLAPLLALLLVAFLAASSGCSTRQDKILANKRLLRGPGGLGTTTRLSLTPDRDTYVGTGRAFFSPTLLVGVDGPLEAQSYFSTSTWTLPPATIPQDSIVSITVVVPIDSLSDAPNVSSFIALSVNIGAFDSSQVWGTGPPNGPAPGLTVAQSDANIDSPLRFALPASYYTDYLKGWGAAPATFPGFAVVSASANALVKLDAGGAHVDIVYFNRPTATSPSSTARTNLTRHFSIRSPLSPAPTGNEATLRLRLDPSFQPFATGDTVRITVQRVDSTWTEAEVSRDQLKLDTTTLGVRSAIRVSAQDSLVAIALPPSIVRYWSAPGAVNEGVLILIAQPYYTPPILARSRESILPIELRISYTGPPPAKF
jgi:hypothetical protein